MTSESVSVVDDTDVVREDSEGIVVVDDGHSSTAQGVVSDASGSDLSSDEGECPDEDMDLNDSFPAHEDASVVPCIRASELRPTVVQEIPSGLLISQNALPSGWNPVKVTESAHLYKNVITHLARMMFSITESFDAKRYNPVDMAIDVAELLMDQDEFHKNCNRFPPIYPGEEVPSYYEVIPTSETASKLVDDLSHEGEDDGNDLLWDTELLRQLYIKLKSAEIVHKTNQEPSQDYLDALHQSLDGPLGVTNKKESHANVVNDLTNSMENDIEEGEIEESTSDGEEPSARPVVVMARPDSEHSDTDSDEGEDMLPPVRRAGFVVPPVAPPPPPSPPPAASPMPSPLIDNTDNRNACNANPVVPIKPQLPLLAANSKQTVQPPPPPDVPIRGASQPSQYASTHGIGPARPTSNQGTNRAMYGPYCSDVLPPPPPVSVPQASTLNQHSRQGSAEIRPSAVRTVTPLPPTIEGQNAWVNALPPGIAAANAVHYPTSLPPQYSSPPPDTTYHQYHPPLIQHQSINRPDAYSMNGSTSALWGPGQNSAPPPPTAQPGTADSGGWGRPREENTGGPNYEMQDMAYESQFDRRRMYPGLVQQQPPPRHHQRMVMPTNNGVLSAHQNEPSSRSHIVNHSNLPPMVAATSHSFPQLNQQQRQTQYISQPSSPQYIHQPNHAHQQSYHEPTYREASHMTDQYQSYHHQQHPLTSHPHHHQPEETYYNQIEAMSDDESD